MIRTTLCSRDSVVEREGGSDRLVHTPLSVRFRPLSQARKIAEVAEGNLTLY